MFPSILKIWIQILVCCCLFAFEWVLLNNCFGLLINSKERNKAISCTVLLRLLCSVTKPALIQKEIQGEDPEGTYKLEPTDTKSPLPWVQSSGIPQRFSRSTPVSLLCKPAVQGRTRDYNTAPVTNPVHSNSPSPEEFESPSDTRSLFLQQTRPHLQRVVWSAL